MKLGKQVMKLAKGKTVALLDELQPRCPSCKTKIYFNIVGDGDFTVECYGCGLVSTYSPSYLSFRSRKKEAIDIFTMARSSGKTQNTLSVALGELERDK